MPGPEQHAAMLEAQRRLLEQQSKTRDDDVPKYSDLGKTRPQFVPPEFDLDHIFTYHQPAGDDVDNYLALREAAKEFAYVVTKRTPRCADQSAAIRLIREAVMTANAAIALGGRVHKVGG